MNTRNEMWKRAAPIVKALVMTLALAGASGPARASEEWSFTARAQASQGFAPAAGYRGSATERATVPSEATSFITRVEASQGIVPSGTRSSSAVGPIAQGEAESFITRVLLSHAGNRS